MSFIRDFWTRMWANPVELTSYGKQTDFVCVFYVLCLFYLDTNFLTGFIPVKGYYVSMQICLQGTTFLSLLNILS